MPKVVGSARYSISEKTVFSDEKMWLLQESYNTQNDWIYALSPEISLKTSFSVSRIRAPSWFGGISHNGVLPLKFIDKGVKINKDVYQFEILEGHLKNEAPRLYPKGDWIVQQDDAPAHRAKVIEAWRESNCPSFITTTIGRQRRSILIRWIITFGKSWKR